MATKKTDTKAKAAKAAITKGKDSTTRARATRTTKAPAAKAKVKVEQKKKGATVNVAERHPRARVVAQHGGKEALAKSLAASLARPDEDTDLLESQLKKSSNKQLLRLARVSATVKEKWGNREKLITALGEAAKKATDKDYLAKLGTYSLPRLLDIATSNARRARA